MRTLKSILCLCLGILAVGFAAAQQVAATPTQGGWKGTWNSNTSAATGDLAIQLVQVTDGKVAAKLRMTRPNNADWKCNDQWMDANGTQQGEEITISVNFGGRCNQNTFTFTVKDGQLKGGYKTQSNAHGAYTLVRDEVIAQVQAKD